jgi:hypothetical protein
MMICLKESKRLSPYRFITHSALTHPQGDAVEILGFFTGGSE